MNQKKPNQMTANKTNKSAFSQRKQTSFLIFTDLSKNFPLLLGFARIFCLPALWLFRNAGNGKTFEETRIEKGMMSSLVWFDYDKLSKIKFAFINIKKNLNINQILTKCELYSMEVIYNRSRKSGRSCWWAKNLLLWIASLTFRRKV